MAISDKLQGLLGNPLFTAGMGLLSASGPSLTPVNPWRGAMGGLLQAQQYRQGQAEQAQAEQLAKLRMAQVAAQMQAAQAAQQRQAAGDEAAKQQQADAAYIGQMPPGPDRDRAVQAFALKYEPKAAITNMGKAPPVPVVKTFYEGDRVVQKQYDSATGKWNEVGSGPRFAPQQPGATTQPREVSRDVGEERVTYRVYPDGREEEIARAPRWAPNKARLVPGNVGSDILFNRQQLRRAEHAKALTAGEDIVNERGEVVMQGDKNATGVKGFLPDAMLQRIDPKGVDTRAIIADLGSLEIRDRSGAAVTAAEFPRLRPFIPSEKDDPATVRKKVRRFYEEYKREIEEQETFWREQGYEISAPAAGGLKPRSGQVLPQGAVAPPVMPAVPGGWSVRVKQP